MKVIYQAQALLCDKEAGGEADAQLIWMGRGSYPVLTAGMRAGGVDYRRLAEQPPQQPHTTAPALKS